MTPADRRAPLEQVLREVAAVLEPAPRHRALAERLATRIADAVSLAPPAGMRWIDSLPFGSLSRGTALAAFSDIDRVLLLDVDRRGPAASARATLQALHDHVAEIVEAGEEPVRVRLQDHSIGVAFVGTCVHVDLVPMVPRPDRERVRLPEASTDTWIPARPAAMQRRLARAASAQPATRPAIRLLKSWRGANGVHLKSYAVDLLVARAAERSRAELTVDELVRDFFERIARHDARRPLQLGRATMAGAMMLRDPWTRRNVLASSDVSERRALVRACRLAIRRLEEIERCLVAADWPGARARADDLFIGDAATAIDEVRRLHAPPLLGWPGSEMDDS